MCFLQFVHFLACPDITMPRNMRVVFDRIVAAIPRDFHQKPNIEKEFKSILNARLYCAPEAENNLWMQAYVCLVGTTRFDPSRFERNERWVQDVFLIFSDRQRVKIDGEKEQEEESKGGSTSLRPGRKVQ